MIDDVRIEADEDGWHLVLSGDFSDEIARYIASSTRGNVLNLRLPQDAADQLLEQVKPIQEWVAEGKRQRAAYDRASPEEREAVIRVAHLDCGVDRDRIEDMRTRADEQRKRERENRP